MVVRRLQNLASGFQTLFCCRPSSRNMLSKEDNYDDRKIYQPLHPSVRDHLDPEYVKFHDEWAQYVEPDYLMPWSPAIRTRQVWPYSGSPLVEVKDTKDVEVFSRFRLRLFTPSTKKPRSGWPVFIWFHGGGWAGGNIDSDNDTCTEVCKELSCLVINVDYRLAPEHPYPAAVEDAFDTLRWIANHDLCGIDIDRSKVAVGGSSAGATLAAVLALRAPTIEPSIHLLMQILVVPVCDNTATVETRWSAHPHAPWLGPERMTWYRSMYIKNDTQKSEVNASPLFAPPELLARAPPTWVAVAGQDMLITEGLEYTEKLKANGVKTTVRTYPGVPHSMMALAGVLTKGRQCQLDLIATLAKAFTECDAFTDHQSTM